MYSQVPRVPPEVSSACYVAYMHNGWDSARFRDLLKRIMDEADLSQRDVADLAGISRPQVSRWLSGAHRPNFDALQKFATAVRRYPGQEDAIAGLLAAAGYPDAAGDSPSPAPPAAGLPDDDPVLEYVRSLPGLTPDVRGRLEYVARAPGDLGWRFALVGGAIMLLQADQPQTRSA